MMMVTEHLLKMSSIHRRALASLLTMMSTLRNIYSIIFLNLIKIQKTLF